MSVGLAGVRAAGRRGHQGGGGVRLEGAARAGDRAGGPLLIGQADTTQAGQMIGRVVRCSSGRPTPPRPGRSGRPSPWAVRSFPVLIGAAAVLIGAGRGQKKSQGGRRRPFTLAFSFLLIEAGRVLPGADRGRGRRALVPAAPDPPARVPLTPFRGGTVSPPDDPAKCRRAKGSDSSLNGISPHR